MYVLHVCNSLFWRIWDNILQIMKSYIVMDGKHILDT